MTFEVVLENLEEAKVAQKYEVKRIELCSGLDLGGLTPSLGSLESVVDYVNCEVHAMIRPRGGGFIYNTTEVALMKRDITVSGKVGCKGVVFGLLTDKQSIDLYNTALLVEHARALGLEVTFHRAIDFTHNIHKSVESLISMGATRILTSGGRETVDEGLSNIAVMRDSFKSGIQIMAGGGVNVSNAKKLKALEVDAIHFNIRKRNAHQSNTLMGIEYEIDENKIRQIIFDF